MRFFIPPLVLFSILYGMEIDIDLTKQKLYLKDGNKTVLVSPVSTGNQFHPTPVGEYAVFQKERYHKSTLYPIHEDGSRGGAKMDYMLKFAPAIAIHEGYIEKENGNPIPVSHGCVRVPTSVAKKLFEKVGKGTKVRVFGQADYNNNFNRNLVKEEGSGQDMLYFDTVYDGESRLNISMSTEDIEELEE